MSLSEKVGPLLAARAATDPDAAKLLEMFTKAEKMLNESSPARIGGLEMSMLFTTSNVRRQTGTQWLLNSARSASKLIPDASAITTPRGTALRP